MENGYPKTVASIWIDRETNELRCSSKDHQPTKEESERIVEDLKGIVFPKSISVGLSKAREVEAIAEAGAAIYFIHDRSDKNKVIFVQEVRGRGSEKVFVPHTFFDDGEWRIMEPDGLLPFWKPEKKRRGVARIMCHEGAKAAAAAEGIACDSFSSHPWAETLRLYEHWGMLGGAHAAHRVNYEEIAAEAPKEFVYAADNDYPGWRMIQEVSRHCGRSMKCVKYGSRFPMGWDMADPMPQSMFGEKGRFIGPNLIPLFHPATRATELIHTGRSGRPAAVLREDFCREWVHVVRPEVYAHVDRPNVLYGAEQFNNTVRPFSDVENTASLVKANDAIKAIVVKYDPSAPTGILSSPTGTQFNTFVPSGIRAEEGSAEPFEKYLEHLVPLEEDRREVKRWIATLIALPEVKMHYGMLLSGPQGVGKSTLGEKILTPLVGEDNTSTPSESDITESAFNYWQPHRRLAIIHEIYSGQSSKAYNKLKSAITDRDVEVNQKFMAVYRIENWCHIFACSNSRKPIQMSTDDRRWLVPAVTEKTKPSSYWVSFNHWLERDGGLGKIKGWAEEHVKTSRVVSGEEAPWTSTKLDIVEEGMSEGMRFVSNFMSAYKEEMNGTASFLVDVVVQDVVRDFYHGGKTDKLERPFTIRKVLKACGWHVNIHGTIPYRLKWGQAGRRGFIVCSTLEDAQKTFEQLEEEGRRPMNVGEMAQKWGLVKNL